MLSHTIRVRTKSSQEKLAGKDVLYLDPIPFDIHAPSHTLCLFLVRSYFLIKPTSVFENSVKLQIHSS